MKRIDQIYHHEIYQKQFLELQKNEADRVFCRHTMEHFLDVARLMYIRNLEENGGFEKEFLYATALIHDIGRNEQIVSGEPHEIAGARLAEEILSDCGFRNGEIRLIQAAILEHRGHGSDQGFILEGQEEIEDYANSMQGQKLIEYLYWADKRSRNCFSCPVREECNWDKEKMNLTIKW